MFIFMPNSIMSKVHIPKLKLRTEIMFFNRHCLTFICSFNLSRRLITDSPVCLQVAEMYCLSRENDVFMHSILR